MNLLWWLLGEYEGTVARFVFEPRKLYANGKPKANVFSQERHPELGHLETSVCGLHGIRAGRLWFLGNTVRAPLKAIAAVELPVTGVTAAGLQCKSAPEQDYVEHGVIVGWEDGEGAKDKRLAASLELVAAVTAVHQPPGKMRPPLRHNPMTSL